MDPISKMVRKFTEQWQRFRMSEGARLFRIDTDFSMHRDLGRLLRGFEQAPDNRSPYLIFQVPFHDRGQFYQAATEKLLADYALLKDGLASDGVKVGGVTVLRDGDQSPEQSFAKQVMGVWEQVQRQFECLTLVFLPSAIEDKAAWPETLERLIQHLQPSPVRVAVADVPDGILVGLADKLGKRCMTGRFFVSSNTLQDYLLKVAAGGWPAVAGGAKPTVSGASIPYARLRTLMAAAANASAQRKPKQAIEALREAREVCQQNNLLTEEAVVLMSIGNTHLAKEEIDEAIQQYQRSVNVATKASNPGLAAQTRMALASAQFRKQDYNQAALSYEQAAQDAAESKSDISRIESLRMAGTCHNFLGEPEKAMRCWQAALGTGQSMTPAAIDASTFDEVGKGFVDLCHQHGLTEQAKSVAQQVESIKRQVALRAKDF